MPELKVGDVVLYSAFGRTLNALVIGVHTGDLSHQGANAEPLLDIIYIDPARESAIEKKQIGYHPRVYTEYSVVHASHEFSAEFLTEKRITTAAQVFAARGQGEWSEVIVSQPNVPPDAPPADTETKPPEGAAEDTFDDSPAEVGEEADEEAADEVNDAVAEEKAEAEETAAKAAKPRTRKPKE